MRSTSTAAGLLAGSLLFAGCASTTTDESGSSGSAGNPGAAAGFDPTDGEINVGVILPFSGPLATAGEGLLQGMQLYVDRVNADGGVAGKYPIKLVTGDSKYDPQASIAAYNGMAQDVVMMGGLHGTAVIGAVLPQAKEDDMLIVPTGDNAQFVREPNTLPVRPSTESSMINGVAYALELEGEDSKVCVLSQDDPYGEIMKGAVDVAVDELGTDVTEDVSFAVTNTDFTPQISRLKSAGCEVVAFGSTAASVIPAMSSAVQLDFTPKWVATSSGFSSGLLGSPVIEYMSENWIISSPGAEWADTAVPGMVQLMEDLDSYAEEGAEPQPILNVAGYTYMMATAAVLEAAVEAGDLSHAAVLEISHSDLDLDFLGLSPALQYGPVEERKGPTEVTIFGVDDSVAGGLAAIEKGFDTEAAQAFQAE